MKIQALRGAIFCENSVESINEAVVELYRELLIKNNLTLDNLVCVLVSTTKDLVATCPATAIRFLYKNGENPSLFSLNEPEFVNGAKGVIRLLILAYTDKKNHVYLRGAEKLLGGYNEDSN